ncbi:MAG: RNA polymerase sigma factor [Gemmatimonadales bacterium]
MADLATLGRGTFARLVAQLANEIGRHHVDLAEDAVQEAFAAATRTWPTQGEPADPAAWLYRVAKNRAIDGLRRAPHEPLDPSLPAPNEPVAAVLGDPELALVFLCCHPALGRAAQVTLTLKVAAGFSVAEIARLFRTEPDAIDQRLVRSKRTLRALGREVELLPGDLPARLDAVLEVLYGMFSEGYSSISAPDGIRADLCRESLRLVGLLLEDPRTASVAARALGALFAFHHARLAGRVNDHGQLLLLRDQDRSRWDQGMIARGLALLATSAAGSLTRYHLEAEIASCHAVAPGYDATDWDRIVELYTLLEQGWPSAPVATGLPSCPTTPLSWRRGQSWSVGWATRRGRKKGSGPPWRGRWHRPLGACWRTGPAWRGTMSVPEGVIRLMGRARLGPIHQPLEAQ